MTRDKVYGIKDNESVGREVLCRSYRNNKIWLDWCYAQKWKEI